VNELWRFNVTSSSWSLITEATDSQRATPLAAVGHSAHCIENSMFVIFGHHQVYGYLNTVQRYDFGEMSCVILFVCVCVSVSLFVHTIESKRLKLD